MSWLRACFQAALMLRSVKSCRGRASYPRKQMQPLSGIGQPERIAGVVAFLVGPDGSWTPGEVVEASGGTKL